VGVTDPGVDPRTALKVNTEGTVNLLEGLRGANVERIVLTGTCYEYGVSGGSELDPFNGYSASKVAAWAFGRMYWRAHELPVITVRPFQTYGPGQPTKTLIPSAIGAALNGEDFPMTPGEQVRDFIFAEDVARGMIAAAGTSAGGGQSLDLGTGRGVAVLEVVETIWDLTGARGKIRAGALAYRQASPMHLVADADQTARMTGWRATTGLRRGLRITIDALKSGSGQAYEHGTN
jgi:nucleoside-diphosphate-sugar epimerase